MMMDNDVISFLLVDIEGGTRGSWRQMEIFGLSSASLCFDFIHVWHPWRSSFGSDSAASLQLTELCQIVS